MNRKTLLSALALGLAGAASALVIDTEPNNLPSGANLFNRVGNGAFADIALGGLTLGDSDFYKIRLNAGDFFSAIVFPTGVVYSEPDTYLGLIDPTGTTVLIGSDDDGIDPGDEYGSALRFQIPTTGDYYIAVAGYNDTFFEDEIESYIGENGDGVIDSVEVGNYNLVVGVSPVPSPGPGPPSAWAPPPSCAAASPAPKARPPRPRRPSPRSPGNADSGGSGAVTKKYGAGPRPSRTAPEKSSRASKSATRGLYNL